MQKQQYYFLTTGLLGALRWTPCSWMLLTWWYCGKSPLQQTITDDSKKLARLCSSVCSHPVQSYSVSSQLTPKYLENRKRKFGAARLGYIYFTF